MAALISFKGGKREGGTDALGKKRTGHKKKRGGKMKELALKKKNRCGEP